MAHDNNRTQFYLPPKHLLTPTGFYSSNYRRTGEDSTGVHAPPGSGTSLMISLLLTWGCLKQGTQPRIERFGGCLPSMAVRTRSRCTLPLLPKHLIHKLNDPYLSLCFSCSGTTLRPVFIYQPSTGRRLSWPGRLTTYEGGTSMNSHPSQYKVGSTYSSFIAGRSGLVVERPPKV